ncbi:MAG: endonuclease III domain-containing protein [Acidobacteriia bacterium]|nr:endonuclease III domain-containing protein [Terriglobia bacterium]
MTPASSRAQIRAYYEALYSAWGPQHWWPARTRFEVIVGAYLTQNTSWKNVEIALRRLHAAGLLNLAAIRAMPLRQLEALVRPAGYFRQKAARLKTFVAFVERRHRGSLQRLFEQPTQEVRQELLSLNGVGPETADSILLYAGQHPVFVVDTYTRRILERHGIVLANAKYEELRELVELALTDVTLKPSLGTLRTQNQELKADFRPVPHPPSPMSLAQRSPLAQVYNEMHGLMVAVGKHYCFRSEPNCALCPLRKYLP